ncbi:hypothetical protein OIO90_005690 [Microbotryomycetes sp. JL221]|nr:hypothetical protein OIO90_005690 [Microbotryomycetes sp. JL221]
MATHQSEQYEYAEFDAPPGQAREDSPAAIELAPAHNDTPVPEFTPLDTVSPPPEAGPSGNADIPWKPNEQLPALSSDTRSHGQAPPSENIRWLVGCGDCAVEATPEERKQEARDAVNAMISGAQETCPASSFEGISNLPPAASETGSDNSVTSSETESQTTSQSSDSGSTSSETESQITSVGTLTSTPAASTRNSTGTGNSDGVAPPANTSTPPDSAAGHNGLQFGFVTLALVVVGFAVVF